MGNRHQRKSDGSGQLNGSLPRPVDAASIPRTAPATVHVQAGGSELGRRPTFQVTTPPTPVELARTALSEEGPDSPREWMCRYVADAAQPSSYDEVRAFQMRAIDGGYLHSGRSLDLGYADDFGFRECAVHELDQALDEWGKSRGLTPEDITELRYSDEYADITHEAHLSYVETFTSEAARHESMQFAVREYHDGKLSVTFVEIDPAEYLTSIGKEPGHVWAFGARVRGDYYGGQDDDDPTTCLVAVPTRPSENSTVLPVRRGNGQMWIEDSNGAVFEMSQDAVDFFAVRSGNTDMARSGIDASGDVAHHVAALARRSDAAGEMARQVFIDALS